MDIYSNFGEFFLGLEMSKSYLADLNRNQFLFNREKEASRRKTHFGDRINWLSI